LKLNEKDEDGYYPLLIAIDNNNIKIVKILIEYANQHQIILDLNEKNNVGNYPILDATIYNNIEMIKLLIKYALQHQITLVYNKNEIDSNYGKLLLQNYEQEKGLWVIK